MALDENKNLVVMLSTRNTLRNLRREVSRSLECGTKPQTRHPSSEIVEFGKLNTFSSEKFLHKLNTVYYTLPSLSINVQKTFRRFKCKISTY